MEKLEDEMFDLKPSIIYSTKSDDQAGKLISFEKYYNTAVVHDHDKAQERDSEIINFSSSLSNSSFSHKVEYDSEFLEKTSSIRSPWQAQEHVMAERKRRHNLSQLFISLSKLLPRLNKLDKASLLENGINYLKSLEQRVRVLEEKKEMIISSSVLDISKHEYHISSSVGINRLIFMGTGPVEIQARISDKHVLIKVVLCNRDTEYLSRIAGEMEKIHLNVMDMIRIMPFGLASFHITILAQMQSEFKGTVKDIVDHLHTLFFNPSSSQ